MILRLSDSLSRGLIVLVSLVLAAVVSFYGLRMGAAQVFADMDTEEGLLKATRLEPRNAEYWYRLGHFEQFNLEQTDTGAAERYFRAALAIDPKYTDAWLDLGTTLELNGDAAGAKEAFRQAKLSYPASAEVEWRYGNYLLRQGQKVEAYEEFRKSLLADPTRAAAAFTRCYRSDPNVDEILDRVLPSLPAVYVDVIRDAVDSKQFGVALTVWKRLLALRPTLKPRDFDSLAARLLQEGDIEQAYAVWQEGTATMVLPALLQTGGGTVWDPSFEAGIEGYAFSWRYQPLAQGVQTTLDPTERLSGMQSLRLSFDGKHNPALEAACIFAPTKPNTKYVLSGWIKTKDLTTEHGVGFHLRPIGGEPPGAMVVSRELHGTNPWTYVDVPWMSGPGVTRAVVCVSRDPSDNPDVRISGHAWVDDVNLTPAATAALAPAGTAKP